MTKRETDLELIGRVYRDQMATTKQDWQAYQACLGAWRERHPNESAQEVRETVAQLIADAASEGLVRPNSRWWES